MPFDKRTEKNIATLLPDAQKWARLFVQACLDAGHNIRILDGNRTYAQQNALFAKGRRGIPGEKKVTNARGGQSNHNFGIAWDIGIFSKSGVYQPESPEYAQCGVIGRNLGLEWGGDWVSFTDRPHYQCKTGLGTAALRKLVSLGKKIPIPSVPGQSGGGGGGTVTPPAPLTVPVKVLLKGQDTGVPGFLEDSRVWVAARKATEALGGAITTVVDSPFSVTINHNGQDTTLSGKKVKNSGYVKFADLNTLLGYDFSFDSAKGELKLK